MEKIDSNSIKNVGTVKELYDFLKEKIENDPELYENGLVAIATPARKELTKSALYSIKVEVEPSEDI